MKTYLNLVRTIFAMVMAFAGTQAFAAAPNQVLNVQTTIENETIRLSWDDAESEDDIIVGYRIYYGTNSVQTADDNYTENPIDTGVENEYVFTDLDKNTTYYFAITAIDSIDQESNNYSIEVSANMTPQEVVEPTEEIDPATESTEPTENEVPTEEFPEEAAPENPIEEEFVNEAPQTTENVEPTNNETMAAETFQESAPDSTPPSSAKYVTNNTSGNNTTISWSKSTDTDVQTQKIAVKQSTAASWTLSNVDIMAESTKIYTEENKTYMVKIITIDRSGNESESDVKTFSTTLTESGPATNLAILIAIAFLGMILFSVKRRA